MLEMGAAGERLETGLKIRLQHRSEVHPEDRVRERARARHASEVAQASS